MLTVQKLSWVRHNIPLFQPVSFDLARGQVILITGDNGAGKSTLLKMLTGMISPHMGVIKWQQSVIQNDLPSFQQQIHYIGHTNGIRSRLTVAENLRCMSFMGKECDSDIAPVLSALSLLSYMHTQAQCLSAGQKRRLSLAKLFFIKKKLWILDEPLTSLDKTTQDFFYDQLMLHLQSGGMCMMSSHSAIPHMISISQCIRLTPC